MGPLKTMAVSFVVAGGGAAAVLLNFGLKENGTFPATHFTRAGAPDESGGHLTAVKAGVDPDSAPAPVVVARPSAAAAAPKDSWIKHIRGLLAEYKIQGPATQRSQASASVAVYSGAPAPASPTTTVASSPAAVPQPGPASQPAYVKYGTVSRSDIMSSASGPVYNFTGKRP